MELSQLRAVIVGLPLALLVIDERSRVRIANHAARELLGVEPEGRSYVAVIRQPSTLDCVEKALADGRQAGARFVRTTSSSETTYRVVATPLADESAGIAGVIVSFEDVSHVEEAEQMRRDFIANVSHELRSPLTALSGFIETLRGAAREDPAARERFLAIMEQEAHRMNRLVSDLLSLSKVEVDERVRPRDEIDLLEVVRSTIAALRPLTEAADLEIVNNQPEGDVIVAGDQDQLMQVFYNLIENAVKYGGAGGDVSVVTQLHERFPGFRGPAVQIDVVDRGDGIDSEHIPRLTERFYRVDSDRSREKGGTGLGLAIVKHIVNRHRGRFRIESERGVGSRFSVVLPMVEGRG